MSGNRSTWEYLKAADDADFVHKAINFRLSNDKDRFFPGIEYSTGMMDLARKKLIADSTHVASFHLSILDLLISCRLNEDVRICAIVFSGIAEMIFEAAKRQDCLNISEQSFQFALTQKWIEAVPLGVDPKGVNRSHLIITGSGVDALTDFSAWAMGRPADRAIVDSMAPGTLKLVLTQVLDKKIPLIAELPRPLPKLRDSAKNLKDPLQKNLATSLLRQIKK